MRDRACGDSEGHRLSKNARDACGHFPLSARDLGAGAAVCAHSVFATPSQNLRSREVHLSTTESNSAKLIFTAVEEIVSKHFLETYSKLPRREFP